MISEVMIALRYYQAQHNERLLRCSAALSKTKVVLEGADALRNGKLDATTG
jgi:hypothetical protein